MITTAIITFREFFEAFLIAGVFLGISRKLKLKKELEIWLAVLIGVILSLLLTISTYLLADHLRDIFTEENADLLGGYLMIFSGLFIAYVIFSLHDVIQKNRGGSLIKAHQKLRRNAFDISLFFTIVLLVLREGFEIALFTTSFLLFSDFVQNFMGLIVGFAFSVLCGLGVLYIYVKFPIEKVFRATEYMIILLGASLTQRGITELIDKYAHIDLSNMLSFHFQFLPSKDTFFGHLLQVFFGIDQEFSFTRLMLMIIYIIIIYLFFIKQKITKSFKVIK